MKHWIGFFYLCSGPLLGLAWLIGWVLKDSTTWSTWFYFIPPLFVLAYIGVWLLLLPNRQFLTARSIVRITGALALTKMAAVDFVWTGKKESATGQVMRVVHWNVARNYEKADQIFAVLKSDRPDICLLSESTRLTNLNEHAAQDLGFEHVLNDSGMTLLSRYPFQAFGTMKLTNGRAWAVRLFTPDGPLDLMALDIISRPNLNRHTPMKEVADWLKKRATDTPLILLGDFNTPRDSTSFNPIRVSLQHAYEVAGRGWPYSWPTPAPLYAIDHAWVSSGLAVHSYSLHPSRWSDHWRQVMEIEIRE